MFRAKFPSRAQPCSGQKPSISARSDDITATKSGRKVTKRWIAGGQRGRRPVTLIATTRQGEPGRPVDPARPANLAGPATRATPGRPGVGCFRTLLRGQPAPGRRYRGGPGGRGGGNVGTLGDLAGPGREPTPLDTFGTRGPQGGSQAARPPAPAAGRRRTADRPARCRRPAPTMMKSYRGAPRGAGRPGRRPYFASSASPTPLMLDRPLSVDGFSAAICRSVASRKTLGRDDLLAGPCPRAIP